MERKQGVPRVNAGRDRHAGNRRTRGWVMGLALLGLGAGAPAQDAGDLAGWNHGSAVPELDQRQCPECFANSPAGSNARMRLDPDRGRLGADTGDAEHLRVEVVPVSAMNVLFPLRAERYADVCKPHRASVRSDCAACRHALRSSRTRADPRNGTGASGIGDASAARVAVATRSRNRQPELPASGRFHHAATTPSVRGSVPPAYTPESRRRMICPRPKSSRLGATPTR